MGDSRRENTLFSLKWGILEEKTRDLWLKWWIIEEKTRDFCLNMGVPKRKRDFCLNGGFAKTRDFRVKWGILGGNALTGNDGSLHQSPLNLLDS